MYMYNLSADGEGKLDLRKEMINIRCATSVDTADEWSPIKKIKKNDGR